MEVGELADELIATLVAAAWSERDAREANVHHAAANPSGRRGGAVSREPRGVVTPREVAERTSFSSHTILGEIRRPGKPLSRCATSTSSQTPTGADRVLAGEPLPDLSSHWSRPPG
jgi:hypothetical protein